MRSAATLALAVSASLLVLASASAQRATTGSAPPLRAMGGDVNDARADGLERVRDAFAVRVERGITDVYAVECHALQNGGQATSDKTRRSSRNRE